MSLAGYDNWKLSTPPEYEEGARIESLIDGDENLSRLQHRVELQEQRCTKLTKMLAAAPASSEERARIAKTLDWAGRVAKYRAGELQTAIEESAEDAYDRHIDQQIDEAREREWDRE